MRYRALAQDYWNQAHWRAVFEALGELPWYEFDVDDHPHGLAFCFGEADDGRLVCTGLLIDPRKNLEVTSRLLRDLRLGEIVSFAALGLPAERPDAPNPHRVRRARPGPAGLPEEHYRRVAEEYRRVLRSYPRTPIVELMKVLGCSQPTAHRYLKRCRELGLLDPR